MKLESLPSSSIPPHLSSDISLSYSLFISWSSTCVSSILLNRTEISTYNVVDVHTSHYISLSLPGLHVRGLPVEVFHLLVLLYQHHLPGIQLTL